MTADRQREVDRVADEAQAAAKFVRRRVRGMSTADAQECLNDALWARGLRLPESFICPLARSMSDPWWPVKHPVAYWNQFQEARRNLGSGDVERPTRDTEFEWLEARLERVDQLRGIWAPGPVGVDRVYLVTIDPWSERVARRARALAAPLEVTVLPLS